MGHAQALVNTYFENWPADEIQTIYKENGFKCMDYWNGELTRIFNSTIRFTPEFSRIDNLEYYTCKYPGTHIRIKDMDDGDRRDIFREFTTQLGIYWEIFPYKYTDF
jgi:hypothetical protein